MIDISIDVVVEGDTDLPVVRKLCKDVGLSTRLEIDAAGKSQIDQNLAGYNQAAIASPWLVLRDLDNDAECAPDWLRELDLRRKRWLCLRLAVREVESWLLADRTAIAKFLGVDEGRVPLDPDAEPDPTLTLVQLARRSPKRALQKAMVPGRGASTAVGPLYEAKIIEFAAESWSLKRARSVSPSLRRAHNALRTLAKRWRKYVQGR